VVDNGAWDRTRQTLADVGWRNDRYNLLGHCLTGARQHMLDNPAGRCGWADAGRTTGLSTFVTAAFPVCCWHGCTARRDRTTPRCTPSTQTPSAWLPRLPQPTTYTPPPLPTPLLHAPALPRATPCYHTPTYTLPHTCYQHPPHPLTTPPAFPLRASSLLLPYMPLGPSRADARLGCLHACHILATRWYHGGRSRISCQHAHIWR